MIDTHGGETFKSAADMDAYFVDGDHLEHIVTSVEWTDWGLTESWATGLAKLIGGEAHQSGGNIWVVLFPRADGKFIVVGLDGADIYESADHYEGYYNGDWPEPGFLYWEDFAGQEVKEGVVEEVRIDVRDVDHEWFLDVAATSTARTTATISRASQPTALASRTRKPAIST